MSESRRALAKWAVDDDLEAVRFQSMQDLAETAQLFGVGKNVRIYRSPNGGGTAIAVDETVTLNEYFTGRILTKSQNGAFNQWFYTFAEIQKTTAGYGGWTDLTGGRTGDAFNLAEDRNAVDSIMGNGVDPANLSGTGLEIMPVPVGARVRLWTEAVSVTELNLAGVEYWFSSNNGVDGTCTP